MKKTFTFCFLLILSGTLFSCCNIGPKSSSLTYQPQIMGYWELSPKYYPRAVAYFNKLRTKYQRLQSVDILILDGPMADASTIYFPMSWIENLEKGNKFYREAAEWIILHELGHIVHRDMYKKLEIPLILMGAGAGLALIPEIFPDNDTSKKLGGALALAGLAAAGMGVAKCCYSIVMKEYLADDYAMRECNNPQACIAAYEFLERYAPLGLLPGLSHSFTKYRLSRIEKGFKKKFGYELVVVPQSLYPKYN